MVRKPFQSLPLVGELELGIDARYAQVGSVYAIAFGIVSLDLIDYLFLTPGPGSFPVKFGGHLLLTGLLLYSMQYFLRSDADAETLRSIVGICLAFGVYGTFIAGLAVLGHVAGGGARLDWSYIVLTGTLGGMIVGVPIGNGYTRLDIAKRAAQDQLQQIDTMTRRLSVVHRVLRHNIRTQVNIIVGYLDLLHERQPDADSERYLTKVEEAVSRLESISENAIRLKRVWETQNQRERRPVHDLIVAGLDPVAEEYPTADVEVQSPPEQVVVCHPFAHWAIEEAARNALAHNPPETTDVEIRAVKRDAYVYVTVADDGQGFPDLEIEALRNPRETQVKHGLGLGLQTIYWTTQACDCKLEFETRESGGTVVTMGFPAESGGADDTGTVGRRTRLSAVPTSVRQ